jgi:hypothetical protein
MEAMVSSNHLIPEPPLLILPTLAKTIGLNEAIMLQQCHYWLQRTDRARGDQRWFYKSTREWLEEFPFFSESTVKRTVQSLRKKGLIETEKINRSNWVHTNWFTINYGKLNELMKDVPLRGPRLVQIDPIDKPKVTRPGGPKRTDRSGHAATMYKEAKTSSENTSKIVEESRKAEEFVGSLPAPQLEVFKAAVIQGLPDDDPRKKTLGKHEGRTGSLALLIYQQFSPKEAST